MRRLLLIGMKPTPALNHGSAGLSVCMEAVGEFEEALRRLRSGCVDISAVVLRLEAADEGAEAIEAVRSVAPDTPLIATADRPAMATVVAALQRGATDFVCDAASEEDWRKAIERVANDVPEGAPPSAAKDSDVVVPVTGRNPGMLAIEAALEQIAWSDAPVLIQGETGSGKEVLARSLHAKSKRAKRPFFKLNCAALPSELVESELFGYERGAFTGAVQRKAGIFEAADGGTILLDEIGDMDVRLQAKLLQVLQDHAFQRIGGKDLIEVDVRVLAATHRDLETSIEEGSFREDLYYRLNVINLVVPPLRERKSDLFELMDALLRKHVKAGESIPALTTSLKNVMLEWSWPGNIRELENFARKLLIFQDCAYAERELRARVQKRQGVRAADIPVCPPEPAVSPAPKAEPRHDVAAAGTQVAPMAEITRLTQRAEADAILAALNAARWNRRVAANMLHVDYKCLLYRMKKLGIEPRKEGEAPRTMAAGQSAGSNGEPEWPAGGKTARAGVSAA